MNKPFSVNEILADAWSFAKTNIWILVGFTAVQFVVIIIITTILAGIFGGESGAGVIAQNLILALMFKKSLLQKKRRNWFMILSKKI